MEKSPPKIGVGILTYNRRENYKKVLNSIPKNKIDYLVIVNDGKFSYVEENDGNFVIHNNNQLGVAKSKNKILKHLIEVGCEHLFIIEDDILIKNENVFEEYIKAANSTGIYHLCFEKVANNDKTLKFIHEQPDGVKLGFYHNPQGAFMYINAYLVKKFGYFDENYINAFEHIDFAYNLIQKKLAPPFWYFPDLYNSEDFLKEIDGSSLDSTITNKKKYKENVKLSAEHFIKKWGHFTTDILECSHQEVLKFLVFLQQHYSRKTYVNKNNKLSIIIPYRDRPQALEKIIPTLKDYVSKQVKNFEIIIVEQFDKAPFNKGLINNIGFSLKDKESNYVCFHDVDLIPEIADYSYPKGPSHISSHCSQFNYVNIPDKIMGGVILFKNEHFEKVNGYSNEYCGWGKEDDDLYARCEKENLIPYKHPFGKFYSIPHPHRLTSQKENELHEQNGKRFQSFLSNQLGENYHKIDGLTSIPNFKIHSKTNIDFNIIHYKIEK